MADLVDITLPDGRPGTVPQDQLSQALAAGASMAPQTSHDPSDSIDGTGGYGAAGQIAGQIATGILGAGRVATVGLTDTLAETAGDVVGGEQTRKDVLKSLSLARQANPWSDRVGEFAGLLAGAGEGVTGLGEAAESAVTSRLGEGLLGKTAGMAARGGVESTLLGAENTINEANLGDVDVNGEKLFIDAPKDLLFGAGAGGVLGAGGYALGKAGGWLRRARGPMSEATADAITGLEGGGKALVDEAKDAENTIENLRRTGAVSDQAATMKDDINTLARSGADADGTQAEGVMGWAKDRYRDLAGAKNEETRAVIDASYDEAKTRFGHHDEKLADTAIKLKDLGDSWLRNGEDVVNNAQFAQKPSRVLQTVDPALHDVQRDATALVLQKVGDALDHWESMFTKGGAPGAVSDVRKLHKDLLYELADAESNGASRETSAKFFTGLDKLRAELFDTAKFGKSAMGLPEAVANKKQGFETLGYMIRGVLEDEAVWGTRTAGAQKGLNATFSESQARRDDLIGRMGQKIDRDGGRPVTSLDEGKIYNALKQFDNKAVRQPTITSTQATIDGLRARFAQVEAHCELSPAETAKLATAKRDLDAFEELFKKAINDADGSAALRRARDREDGHSMGGIFGVFADAFTRPAKTAARLGDIAHFVEGFNKKLRGGVGDLFEGSTTKVSTKVPRSTESVVKEMGDMRELAANPARLEAQAGKMAGDIAEHAPKTTTSMVTTAGRAIRYLASVVPTSVVPMSLFAVTRPAPRYSDQQIHEYETKRAAIMDPLSVLDDAKHGRLNRDSVQAIEAVYPGVFAELQSAALDHLHKLGPTGKLDKMPYQQKALIATLLKVPADGTWQPDFIVMMQAAKAQPAPQSPPAPGAAPTGTSGRAIKLDSSVFGTEAARIEGGGHAA